MKFIPDLIPEKHRVLTEYFKPQVGATRPDTTLDFFSNLLAYILIAIGIILLFIYPLGSLILLGSGCFLLTKNQRIIQRTLRFKLTIGIKFGVLLVMFILSIPVIDYYRKESTISELRNVEQKTLEENERKRNEYVETKRKRKLDSLLVVGERFNSQGKISEAISAWNSALSISHSSEDREINLKIGNAKVVLVEKQISKGHYKNGLAVLDSIVNKYGKTPQVLYLRGVCLAKTGMRREASENLFEAKELGHARASKMYEQVNPLRKRIVGTYTLCCDGTRSSATGRGACSHHGGVCNWSEPDYETSRDF